MSRTTRMPMFLPMLLLAGSLLPLAAQSAQGSYPKMAALSRYLMAPGAEIALARSAAPPAIGRDASVLVLTARGYRIARTGHDGFTCLVERGWTSPFDSTDFWNPRLRGPICYNPAATRTILPYTLRRTQLALAGLTRLQMLARSKASVFATPAPGSMSYMLSKQQYLGDQGRQWYPHIMLYAPAADRAKQGASWGADDPASPIVFDSSHHVLPEPETIFMIPVSKWSDGTAAPSM